MKNPECRASGDWLRPGNWLAAVAVAVAMLPGLAVADGNADAGKIKFETCLGCHGIIGYNNVYPTYRVPRLAGQHPEYIAAALKAYRSGERSHSTMQGQAKPMSDQDIADIAAYVATL